MQAYAKARFVRTSPRKARLVADAIRGKHVGEALALLKFTPNYSARLIEKVVKSAVANAENNHHMNGDNLKVAVIMVDGGPVMKRLRYALEILGPLYDGALDPFIRRAKKMQDLLGSIHDRDVWIDLLPGFLEEERLRSLRFYGHGRSFGALRPGIAGLLEKKKALRSREYALFLDEWDALAKEGFWNDLKTEGETGERGVGKG